MGIKITVIFIYRVSFCLMHCVATVQRWTFTSIHTRFWNNYQEILVITWLYTMNDVLPANIEVSAIAVIWHKFLKIPNEPQHDIHIHRLNLDQLVNKYWHLLHCRSFLSSNKMIQVNAAYSLYKGIDLFLQYRHCTLESCTALQWYFSWQ